MVRRFIPYLCIGFLSGSLTTCLLASAATPATAALIQDTETHLTDFFPRVTNGENGIYLQYRETSGVYVNLTYAYDYMFWTPDAPFHGPLVNYLLEDQPANGIPAGAIQAHPSAVNQIGWDRDVIIRVTLDGSYSQVRVRGKAAKTNGSMRFYIYQGETGYDAPLWEMWEGGLFDFTISYAAGEQLFFAVDAGPSDVNDWSYWNDIRFQGLVSCAGADLTPPHVIRTQPAPWATGVPTTRVISALFAEPLDPSTVNAASFVLRDGTGYVVPAAVSYDSTSHAAVLTPTAPLASGATYTATVTDAVADLSGNTMPSDYSWTFTTGTGTTQTFVEDFSDPAWTAANWSPYGSAFSVSGGIGTLWPDGSVVPGVAPLLEMTFHDTGTLPIEFGDLVYGVDVKMTGARRTMLGFGSRLGNAGENWRFWVGYDIAAVMITCYDDFNQSYTPRSAGTFTLLEDYRPYDGLWHQWGIEISGSDFDFYVDDHHVLTGQLDGYLPGPIGMRSWDAGGAQFDNVVASTSADVEVAPPVVNDPPVSQDDDYTVGQDGVLMVGAPGVLGNDSDPDGDILSVAPVSCPANGTLILNSDGSFAYAPDAGFVGTDSFTYLVSDGQLDSNVATVEIVVEPAYNEPPVCSFQAASTPVGCGAQVMFTDLSFDPDGVVVAWAWEFGDGGTSTDANPTHAFAVGVYDIYLTVMDDSGNTAPCEQTVTVTDDEPPIITCPAHITVANDAGECTAVVEFSCTAADNCPGVSCVCDPPSGTAFPIGTTEVTCTATDASGNAASCSFTVTVTDAEPPVLSLPGDIVAEATSGAGAVVSFEVSATDLVDGTVPVTSDPASGSTFPLGVTTVTCTAVDSSANSVVGTFQVTVSDTTAPSITAPQGVAQEATGALTSVDLGTPSVMDTVDPSPDVSNDAPAAGFAVGSTLVNWTATDASGNSASATQHVTISDTTPPVVTLPGPIEVEAGSPDGAVVEFAATATDLVDGDLAVTSDPVSGSLFPVGVTTVNCTATDAAGNIATGSFTVTVSSAAYANFEWCTPMANADKRLFKRGSTIPIKFRITDLQGNPANDAVATLTVYYYGDGAPEGDPLVVSTANGDVGNEFRNAGDGQYIFNLSTKPPEWYPYWTFVAVVTLDDGQEASQVFYLK